MQWFWWGRYCEWYSVRGCCVASERFVYLSQCVNAFLRACVYYCAFVVCLDVCLSVCMCFYGRVCITMYCCVFGFWIQPTLRALHVLIWSVYMRRLWDNSTSPARMTTSSVLCTYQIHQSIELLTSIVFLMCWCMCLEFKSNVFEGCDTYINLCCSYGGQSVEGYVCQIPGCIRM